MSFIETLFLRLIENSGVDMISIKFLKLTVNKSQETREWYGSRPSQGKKGSMCRRASKRKEDKSRQSQIDMKTNFQEILVMV